MIDPVRLNAARPKDDKYGHAMLNLMNDRHKPLHKWALEHISMDHASAILDIGFGGGQAIRTMHRMEPNARIWGIDPSEASLKKAESFNREAVDSGRVTLSLGSVPQLPYDGGQFNLVTAFETTYFWPRIETCFQDVHRVLKDKGAFLICNEAFSPAGSEALAEALQMQFYRPEELRTLLLQAGFRTVHTYLHTNGSWICVVGIR